MVQAVELTDAQKTNAIKRTCLDEIRLRKAVEICEPGTDLAARCESPFLHQQIKSNKNDYKPGKGDNFCGLTGVKEGRLLKDEHEKYLDIYCKIEPGNTNCVSRKLNKAVSSSSPSPSGEGEKKIQGVPGQTTSSSGDGGAALLLSSSLSISCICIVVMMAMMRPA